MRKRIGKLTLAAVALTYSTLALATELTVHLNGSQPVTRQTIHYQCDAQGASMGLPATVFAVEYINGAGNSLAIVPVRETSLIFANILSGSGARYAAAAYIWWDAAGRSTTFSSDSLAGKKTSICHRVDGK